jgi:hypothetical protein
MSSGCHGKYLFRHVSFSLFSVSILCLVCSVSSSFAPLDIPGPFLYRYTFLIYFLFFNCLPLLSFFVYLFISFPLPLPAISLLHGSISISSDSTSGRGLVWVSEKSQYLGSESRDGVGWTVHQRNHEETIKSDMGKPT